MMYTRTHTVFFSEDDLAPLEKEHARLLADFQDREPHMSHELAERCRIRLHNLSLAIHFLGEEAD
jgi:hypothetical protein